MMNEMHNLDDDKRLMYKALYLQPEVIMYSRGGDMEMNMMNDEGGNFKAMSRSEKHKGGSNKSSGASEKEGEEQN
jgi:hypothetical protein